MFFSFPKGNYHHGVLDYATDVSLSSVFNLLFITMQSLNAICSDLLSASLKNLQMTHTTSYLLPSSKPQISQSTIILNGSVPVKEKRIYTCWLDPVMMRF
jgi:hypothetical protein